MKNVLLRFFSLTVVCAVLFSLSQSISGQEEQELKVRRVAPFTDAKEISIIEKSGWNVESISPVTSEKYAFKPKTLVINPNPKALKNESVNYRSCTFSPPEHGYVIAAFNTDNRTNIHYSKFEKPAPKDKTFDGNLIPLDISPNGRFLLVASDAGIPEAKRKFVQVYGIKDDKNFIGLLGTYAPLLDGNIPEKQVNERFEKAILELKEKLKETKSTSEWREIDREISQREKSLEQMERKASVARLLDVEQGYWIDNETFLLCSADQVVGINAKTAKALYHVPRSQGEESKIYSGFALSPDRKHFVLSKQGSMAVFETKSGRQRGYRESKHESTPASEGSIYYLSRNIGEKLAFSPDGRSLATIDWRKISIWNFEKGTLATSIISEKVYGGRGNFRNIFTWVDGRFLLYEDILIDLKNRLPLWVVEAERYADFLASDNRVNGTFWYVLHRSDSLAIAPGSPLLDDGVTIISDKKNREKKWLLKKGGSVKLEIDLNMSEADKEKVREHFTENLKKHGIKVSNNSASKVRIFTEPLGERVTTDVNVFGIGGLKSFGENQKVSFQAYEMLVTVDGEKGPVWKRSERVHPKGGDMGESKTAQEFIDKQLVQKPDWFLTVELPGELDDPVNFLTYGAIELTAKEGLKYTLDARPVLVEIKPFDFDNFNREMKRQMDEIINRSRRF